MMLAKPPFIKLACIIDDDDIYINLVKKIIDIKKLSENLLIFKNGQEAIAYFTAILENVAEKSFPEIILLDLNMPVMDGWDFINKFTEIKSSKDIKTTLYVVSSSIDPFEIEKAKSSTIVTDYLLKPLNLEDFEALFSKTSA